MIPRIGSINAALAAGDLFSHLGSQANYGAILKSTIDVVRDQEEIVEFFLRTTTKWTGYICTGVSANQTHFVSAEILQSTEANASTALGALIISMMKNVDGDKIKVNKTMNWLSD